MADSSQTSRRRILQVLFGGSLAAVAGAAGFVVSKFLAPVMGDVATLLVGKITEISEGSPKLVKLGTKDVMLFRAGEAVTALDLKCSHAGCTVHWRDEQKNFKCPCHGGEYAMDGKVLHGPPPRPLQKLRVTIVGGEVTITDIPA